MSQKMKVKQGDTVMENCNECRCEASSSSPGCMEVSIEVSRGRHGLITLQVLCSTTQCVLDPATVRGLGAGLGAGLGPHLTQHQQLVGPQPGRGRHRAAGHRGAGGHGAGASAGLEDTLHQSPHISLSRCPTRPRCCPPSSWPPLSGRAWWRAPRTRAGAATAGPRPPWRCSQTGSHTYWR